MPPHSQNNFANSSAISFSSPRILSAMVSTGSGGWQLELNRVSWNGNEPKYDIRSWSPDHTKMGKGVTLTEEDVIALADLLAKEVEFLKED